MFKVITLCLFLLTCSMNFSLRMGEDKPPEAVVDTLKQAIIIMTKKDSVVAWDKWVDSVKDNLWVDACKSITLASRFAHVISWTGDFVEVVHLKAVAWVVGSDEVETVYFTWTRDPIRNLWIREEE